MIPRRFLPLVCALACDIPSKGTSKGGGRSDSSRPDSASPDSDPPDSDPPDSDPPDSGGGDSGPIDTSPPLTEDCSNGADDDADALVDCEDADCVDQPACLESCLDGSDDDGDGLVDCDDPDCGSEPDCNLKGRVRSRVRGGHVTGGAFIGLYPLDSVVAGIRATGVWGTVTVLPEGYTSSWSAPGMAVCTWTVDSAHVQNQNRWGDFKDVVTEREGVALSADCPMRSSAGFLPDNLLVDMDGMAGWVARESSFGHYWVAGEQWYRPGDLEVSSKFYRSVSPPVYYSSYIIVRWEGTLRSSGATWSWE